jgi:hypothetical protein
MSFSFRWKPDVEGLCLIDPARGMGVKRLVLAKPGVVLVLTLGRTPISGLFPRFLPPSLCFAAAVLLVRLLLS